MLAEDGRVHVGRRTSAVASWLQDFDADALRTWARDLGVDTYVGSSGRVSLSHREVAARFGCTPPAMRCSPVPWRLTR
ncbi:hypothetical protein BJD12_13130 [Xanthomonas vesicatoria ATCC 35937]|nr:hypothetical protein BJD12_13130 [Xanthomonas vesicatoria ATCC 35937]